MARRTGNPEQFCRRLAAPGKIAIIRASCGAVAQLGERRVRNAKVGSSILLRSTTRIGKPWKHNVFQGFLLSASRSFLLINFGFPCRSGRFHQGETSALDRQMGFRVQLFNFKQTSFVVRRYFPGGQRRGVYRDVSSSVPFRGIWAVLCKADKPRHKRTPIFGYCEYCMKIRT